MPQTKVIIADDSPTIRSCIREMLAGEQGVSVVGEADDADTTITLIRTQAPDVALLDISMPGGGGLQVLNQLRDMPDAPTCVILTNYPYPEYRKQYTQAGAAFFLDKSSEFEKIPAVLRELAEDGNVHLTSWRVAVQQLIEIGERTRRLVGMEQKQREAERALYYRESMLFALSHAAERFLKSPTWQDVIADVLRYVGEAAQATAGYVIGCDESIAGTGITFFQEWGHTNELTPHEESCRWRRACETLLPMWRQRLRRGLLVAGPTAQFPPEERAVLESEHVQSLIVLPVFLSDRWWGAIGLNDCLRRRTWLPAETEALRAVAAMLGSAVSRADAHPPAAPAPASAPLNHLASAVAYELSNALGVIANAAYYLKRVVGGDDPHVADYLSLITRQIRISEEILGDLSAVSGGTTGSKPVMLEDAAKFALRRCPPAAHAHVAIDFSPNLPPVAVDRRQLSRILSELLTWACRVLPEGGSVTLTAERTNNRVAVRVTDSGHDMDPKELARLLGPDARNGAGSATGGLGLAKELAELNGGTLVVESRLGHGTTIILTLPVAAAGDGSHAAAVTRRLSNVEHCPAP